MPAGIIKKVSPKSRSYYTADDVMELLGVSKSKAYQIVNSMQKECRAAGYLFEKYPANRIPKKYFNKQCMIDDEEVE